MVQHAQSTQALSAAALPGLLIQKRRLFGILLHAVAELIAQTQQELRPWMPLLRRLGEEPGRLPIVLLHSHAEVIHGPQIALPLRVALLCRMAITLDGPVQILLRSLPVFVAHAQIAHRRQIAQLGALLKQFKGPHRVTLHAGCRCHGTPPASKGP